MHELDCKRSILEVIPIWQRGKLSLFVECELRDAKSASAPSSDHFVDFKDIVPYPIGFPGSVKPASCNLQGHEHSMICCALMQRVAECLSEGLQIHFNERVTNIEYGLHGVRVKTSLGATYVADSVVFTASLGVLKVRCS